jgi:glycosyltransferase involved in cell wall biosynthesis
VPNFLRRQGEGMKVLMLSEYPYSEVEQGLGGIMQSTYQLVEGIVALNDPDLVLHVITTSDLSPGYEVRQSGNVYYHFIPRDRSSLGVMIFNPIRLLRHVRRIIREVQPELIHGQGTVTYLMMSLLLDQRNIQTVHGLYRNEQAAIPKNQQTLLMRVKFYVKEKLERYYLRKIRNLIAITSQIVQVMRAEGNHDVRVFNINNAIDKEFFEVAVRRAEKTQSNTDVNILFVAAITPRKGLHVLIEAFKRLAPIQPNIKLTVVGIWDWAREYVEEQSMACQDLQSQGRVVFTGGVGRERLMQQFEDADLFVLPSFSESAPMVISQAMCVGLPIVTTNVGGIPEMLDPGVTGLMLEPGNVDELTDALGRLIEDPVVRKSLGDAARSVGYKRYHPESIARATTAAYRELIIN